MPAGVSEALFHLSICKKQGCRTWFRATALFLLFKQRLYNVLQNSFR